jgi:hypothetical protein
MSEEKLSSLSLSESPAQTQNKPIKVVIGTPCYGGVAFVNYVTSLMNTISLFNKYGIACYPIFIMGESLITRGRNNIVAKFLNDKDATHLIFIDADISWNPVDVLKLVKHDKDIVGGIYPLKTYKWDNLKDYDTIIERGKQPMHSEIPTPKFVQQNLLKYNLNHKYPNLKIQNNLVEAKHIATGFMMIKRQVFDVMIKALPDLKFWDDMGCLNKEEDQFAYTFFDCKTIDGHYLSEDWLFCHRWTELSGTIFVDISINLTHIGTHQFEGRFLSSLSSKKE